MLTVILLPMSLFIGIGAAAIGFTAWPLVVPVLFVLCGFDLYLTLFSSLLVDCGNALVMTIIAVRHGRIAIKQGLALTAFALFWVSMGLLAGRAFIPHHADVFRGSAGIVTVLIGISFLVKGLKNRGPVGASPLPRMGRRHLIWAGVAVMAFQIGLIGIGGGMGYAIFLMLFLAYPVRKATGTAMLMTFGATLFAAGTIFFWIPSDAFAKAGVRETVSLMAALSMTGTAVGAKITYAVSERRIHLLIGVIVIAAGILASAQKFFLQLTL